MIAGNIIERNEGANNPMFLSTLKKLSISNEMETQK